MMMTYMRQVFIFTGLYIVTVIYCYGLVYVNPQMHTPSFLFVCPGGLSLLQPLDSSAHGGIQSTIKPPADVAPVQLFFRCSPALGCTGLQEGQ